jgi:hypothetical protein
MCLGPAGPEDSWGDGVRLIEVQVLSARPGSKLWSASLSRIACMTIGGVPFVSVFWLLVVSSLSLFVCWVLSGVLGCVVSPSVLSVSFALASVAFVHCSVTRGPGKSIEQSVVEKWPSTPYRTSAKRPKGRRSTGQPQADETKDRFSREPPILSLLVGK